MLFSSKWLNGTVVLVCTRLQVNHVIDITRTSSNSYSPTHPFHFLLNLFTRTTCLQYSLLPSLLNSLTTELSTSYYKMPRKMDKVPLKPQTAKEKLYANWVVELRKKVSYLANRTEYLNKSSYYLTQEDLNTLGIELSEMDFRTGVPSGSAPQFFKPTENSDWTLKNTEEPPVSLNDELDKIGFDSFFNTPDDSCYDTERGREFLRILEKRLHLLREKNCDVCQWETIGSVR